MQMHMALVYTHGHRAHVMAAVLAVTVAISAPVTAQAPLPDTPEAFGTVLKTWAARRGVKQAFIVVRRDGHIVYGYSVGGADSKTPVPLASLSKAITGACIATLVRDGKLSFDTPVSSALAKFAARNGGLNRRFGRVTVEQLLTHRAGFGTKKDDPAIGPILVEYLKTHTMTARPGPAYLASVLNHPLVNDPGSKFVYSNTGYLVLGMIIEEATGKLYAPFCREAVLVPYGLAGDLEPDWRLLWSYAGWRMTADDYLSFLDLFAAEDQRLGATAKRWMLDPTGKTVSAESETSWYGLGTYVRKGAQGVNVRHFGSWVGKNKSILTLAVRQSDGTAWFVYVTPRPPRPRTEKVRPGFELERELLAAYRGVKRWN